jgi:hypothetical protein
MLRALLLTVFLAASCVSPSPVAISASPQGDEQRVTELAIRVLFEQLSPSCPLRVRVEEIHGPYLGLTLQDPDVVGGLLILIESRQPFQGRIDTLIHEWGHAMVWGAVRESSHDALWGVATARAYRTVSVALRGPGATAPRQDVEPPDRARCGSDF